MKSALGQLHRALTWVGVHLQSVVLLVIRLYWGWQFIQTGKGKLTHLDRTTNFFASLQIFGGPHLPAPKLNALLAGGTECVGGGLLLLGLGSRFASPALIFVMLTAYATADWEVLRGIFSDPDKFLGADPFLFLAASILVFVFGPGRFALDALIFKPRPTVD
jgi:putative oxidoreductase